MSGGVLSLAGAVELEFVNTYENSDDFDCGPSGGDCNGSTSFGAATNLNPGYLDQGEIDAGADSYVTSGFVTAFFYVPWTWDLHLNPPPAQPGLKDVLSSSTDPDPDGSDGDLGIYGGADADMWDLDGDGAPQAWQPGGYDALTPAEAAGLDCNDTSPIIWNGSPWLDCP